MKKLFILDGSGFLYRAYYAFPPLINEEGKNTNVVYGFIRMILKILAEKPDYFVITWDSPVKTHRHESYPEYKANRKKMEDDFKQQIPITQEMIEKLHLPNLVIPGYEADDIIATLVETYKSDQDLVIDVYSSDKDLKQLLDKNVFCVDPMKNNRIDTKKFMQEFMFSPALMLDYLSLIGDSSDNIPGVAGIGPKKASDLIKQYGNIDEIYAHIENLTPDLKQKLLDQRDIAYMSRDLVRLQMISNFSSNLSDFKCVIDFDTYKNVLVGDYHFSSLEKTLNEMKKKFIMPQQTSLF